MSVADLTIFLGDVQEYLGIEAKQYDESACLLDRKNIAAFQQNPNSFPKTLYTSLGDLPKNLVQVHEILQKAKTIYYSPPSSWSDGKILDILDPGSSLHGLTEILLLLLPDTVEIKNFSPYSPLSIDPIPLVDSRKTQQKQLWIAGCSVSHGEGVTPDERYGVLLAEDLGLSCSFLTRSGSSLSWAADQILRSDIRSGDLVVWGLTTWPRFTYVNQHKLLPGVTVSHYERYPWYQKIVDINQLDSQQTFYDNFYSILQVINYCKQNGSQLFLVGLLNSNYTLLGFLKSCENFIQIPYQLEYLQDSLSEKFLDIGTDNIHPGPKQHQIYKKIIKDFIVQYDKRY